MDNKKIGVYVFLSLLVLSAVSTMVSAQTFNMSGNDCSNRSGWDAFQCSTISFISPIGFDNPWTGIVLGIMAAVVLFAIVYDVALLVLPFSGWVNVIIAIAFIVAAAMVGLIRSLVGWFFTAGSYIVGGAGILATVMSAVMIFLAIIVVFFGGGKVKGWMQRIKQNRRDLEQGGKAHEGAREVVEATKAMRAQAEALEEDRNRLVGHNQD